MAEPLKPRNQGAILAKIIAYLKSRNRSFDESALIEGYCQGITSLWLYAMWLGTQPESDMPRDDIVWFNNAVDQILAWNENKTDQKTKKNIDVFERFIAHIQLFQQPYHYLPKESLSLPHLLKDTRGRKLNDEFKIAGLFTKDQVEKLLQDPALNLIRDGRLILISSHNHATGLFKMGKQWWYFDPNNPKKIEPIERNAPLTIAPLIFEANGFDPRLPSPLAINMFSFDEKPDPPYPEHLEVFKKIGYQVKPPKIGYADNYTDLIIAAQAGSLESVTYHLTQGADPNAKNSHDQTALMLAMGHKAVVEMLLARGADPNIKNKDGQTALILASQAGMTEVVALLLKKDADFEAKDINGQTALMVASQRGNTTVVEMLLKTSPPPEKNNKDTALKLASENGIIEVVKVLLENGANPNAKDSTGQTVLMIASEYGKTEVVGILLKKHADPNMKNNNGQTTLMSASQHDNTAVVKMLLDNHADPNIQDDIGRTALMFASQHESTDVVKTLLDNHANLDLQDTDGLTALMFASMSGHKAVVEMLLARGADPNIKNKDGQTALMIAKENEKKEIVETLSSHSSANQKKIAPSPPHM